MNSNNNAMLAVFIILALVVGFLFGRMTAAPAVTPNAATTQNNTAPRTAGEPSAETNADAGTTVNTSSLTPGQRAMLTAMGIDADTFVITPTMVACAESSIGASRVAEIRDGATPTMAESAKLIVCYK